jgi:hypothetical protein
VFAAFVIAVPQAAPAMGPISAAQKNQGARPAPEVTGTTTPAPRPHHHAKHHHHSSHKH